MKAHSSPLLAAIRCRARQGSRSADISTSRNQYRPPALVFCASVTRRSFGSVSVVSNYGGQPFIEPRSDVRSHGRLRTLELTQSGFRLLQIFSLAPCAVHRLAFSCGRGIYLQIAPS